MKKRLYTAISLLLALCLTVFCSACRTDTTADDPSPNPQPPVQDNPQPPVQDDPQPPVQDDPQPPVQDDPQPPVQDNPQPPVQDDPQPPVQDDPQPPVQDDPQPPVQDDPQPPETQEPGENEKALRAYYDFIVNGGKAWSVDKGCEVTFDKESLADLVYTMPGKFAFQLGT